MNDLIPIVIPAYEPDDRMKAATRAHMHVRTGDMLEAIRAKDSVGAVKLVDKHLSRYQVDEYQIREEFPEYFK